MSAKLYGRILDERLVASSIEETCEIQMKKSGTRFNLTSSSSRDDAAEKYLADFKTTKHDVVSAVKRQIYTIRIGLDRIFYGNILMQKTKMNRIS